MAALAAVFGVTASYLVDRDKKPTVLDEDTLAAVSEEAENAILRESARIPEREKQFVLGIVKDLAGRPK